MPNPLFLKPNLLLAAACIALAACPLHAQTSTVTRSEFEVASIRQRVPGSAYYPGNLDLDATDYFRYTGGLIQTNGRLINYILFAYKISDTSQYPLLQAQLPKWAQEEEFTVEARGGNKPTKDEVRLMMQSLLTTRFKLALHTETHQLPAYVLVLDKPGTRGPQLKPHPDDALCTTMPDKSTPQVNTPEARPWCGLILWPVNHLSHMRMMAFTMEQIAGGVQQVGTLMGGLDQLPILDRTGLSGKFDINLEFLRTPKNPPQPNAESAPEEPGTTFVESLKTQAGLKLIKQTSPVSVFIIDHVEPPSEN
jgi:uncharacterized protein (TIGR03435 family)